MKFTKIFLICSVIALVQTQSIFSMTSTGQELEELRIKVEQGDIQFNPQAIAAVSRGAEDPDPVVRHSAFCIFMNLVIRKYAPAYEAAIAAASLCVEDLDPNVRDCAFLIFELLVCQGEAYDVATKVAMQRFRNLDTRCKALELFTALVKKGQACEAATVAAVEGFWYLNDEGCWDPDDRCAALELFIALVKRRCLSAYAEAEKVVIAVEEALLAKDDPLRCGVRRLGEALARANVTIERPKRIVSRFAKPKRTLERPKKRGFGRTKRKY